MDSAEEVFGRRGFGGASIDEICRTANLTRGAFYSSFTSKDDLFFALYDRMVRQVEAEFARMVQGITVERHDVSGLIADIVAAYPIDRTWFLLFSEFNLHAIRNPEVAKELAVHRSRMLEAIGSVVDALFEANRFVSPVPTILIARLILAMHEGNFSQSEIEPDRLKHGALLETFCPLLLAGLMVAGRSASLQTA